MYYRAEWYPPAPIVGTFHPFLGWGAQEVPVLTCTCFTIYFYEGVPTHTRPGFPRRTLARAGTHAPAHAHASCTPAPAHAHARAHARTRCTCTACTCCCWPARLHVLLACPALLHGLTLPFFSPLLCPSFPSLPFLLPSCTSCCTCWVYLLHLLPAALVAPAALSYSALHCTTMHCTCWVVRHLDAGSASLRVIRSESCGFVPHSS